MHAIGYTLVKFTGQEPIDIPKTLPFILDSKTAQEALLDEVNAILRNQPPNEKQRVSEAHSPAEAVQGEAGDSSQNRHDKDAYQCCVCDLPSTGPVCDDATCGANAFKVPPAAPQSTYTSASQKQTPERHTDQEAVLQALRNNGYRTE